jgi:probable rRNA maturation factor
MGRRTRLHVEVSSPDGAAPAARGLAVWLADLAPARARGAVTVAIIGDRRMRVLNRTFRGKDYATDVLSFPVGNGVPGVAPREPQGDPERGRGVGRGDDPSASFGDIVIASGVAARQAREHGHAVGTEYRVLALHGLLHLLGYDHDHPADRGRMARAEARLRKKGGLPAGLLARAALAPTSDSRSRQRR